jgi:predicted nucleic acid-binding protein
MGALTLPASGLVYVDTMIVIYTVERFPVYSALLLPLWLAAQARSIQVVTSELTLMESLVGPLKTGNTTLTSAFEQMLLGADTQMLPITQPILRETARLRATVKLRTPDALHAATARQAGSSLFVTNDYGYRQVAGLQLAILDDLLTP